MKKYTKLSIFFAIICLSMFSMKPSSVSANYSDEGIAFYAQTSSSGYATEGIAFYAYDPQAAQPTGSVPVYRFFKSATGDHFYTADNTLDYTAYGYKAEGVAFYANDPNTVQPVDTSAVYRFFNASNNKHFYTASVDEKNALINNPQWGYIIEGIAFYAYDTSQINGTVPVYRFYNSISNDHFYTASESEKNSISQTPVYRFYNPSTRHHFYTAFESERSIVANTSQSGYIPEGIAFYVYNTQTDGTSPVYRFNNASTDDHFYTAIEDEKNALINNTGSGYIFEGIAFYAKKAQSQGYNPVYRFYSSQQNDHFYTTSEAERYSLLIPPLGPEISVGLWYFKRDYNPAVPNIPGIMKTPFQIDANKAYNIKDVNGTTLISVDGNSTTSISFNDPDNQLTVTVGKYFNNLATQTVTFDAADGDNSTLIFNTHNSYYPNPDDWRRTLGLTHYRGKIKIQYYRGDDIFNYPNDPAKAADNYSTQFWVSNILPLEQYAWGAAEFKGTDNINHADVMSTAFRSFGFKRLNYPKYIALGFRVRSDSLDQTYGGYDWGEIKYPNVKKGAQQTRGTLVTYGNDVAIAPYSSWSDGRTVASPTYAWCQAKDDLYGNYNDSYWNNSPKMTHDELVNAHNHMIGLIAQGSVRMAREGWDWQRILHYYYTNIGLSLNY